MMNSFEREAHTAGATVTWRERVQKCFFFQLGRIFTTHWKFCLSTKRFNQVVLFWTHTFSHLAYDKEHDMNFTVGKFCIHMLICLIRPSYYLLDSLLQEVCITIIRRAPRRQSVVSWGLKKVHLNSKLAQSYSTRSSEFLGGRQILKVWPVANNWSINLAWKA